MEKTGMVAYGRKNRIIEYLEQNGMAEVSVLSGMLGVVPETIRRDLRELEKQKILIRTHGGALMRNRKEKEYPVQVRVARNSVEKDRICMKAAGFINDGDMIFVDNSSTLINLIKYIDDQLQVTILTNSIKVLQEYANQRKDNVSMICTGGIFNKSNMSLSGTIGDRNTYDFFPSKAFVSCHGVSSEFGFTDGNFLEVNFKREMIKLAREVFFLVDHTKFEKLGPIRLGDWKICDVMVTDKAPSEEFMRQIGQTNPQLRLEVCETVKGAV